MELSSGSCSSGRSKFGGGRKMCKCGLPAKMMKAWTDRNPGRKFFGCELYQVGNQCNFFEWFDEGEISGWPKRALIEALDEIREKNRVIDHLGMKISELEKQQLNIPLTDNEIREGNGKGKVIEWESKLVDVEAMVSRQRMIITVLAGLLICVIGVIVLRQ